MFTSSEIFEKGIKLRTVTNVLSGIWEVILDRVTSDMSFSASRLDFTWKNLESGGFTSTINTKQGKAFTLFDTEGDSIYSNLDSIFIRNEYFS